MINVEIYLYIYAILIYMNIYHTYTFNIANINIEY